jgi:hypothetical protein
MFERGDVLWLDPMILIAGGAQITCGREHWTRTMHAFLCLNKFKEDRSVWSPLTSRVNAGKARLPHGGRRGPPSFIQFDGYYNPCQGWIVKNHVVSSAIGDVHVVGMGVDVWHVNEGLLYNGRVFGPG